MRVLAEALLLAGRPVALRCPFCGSLLFEAEIDDRVNPETGWVETAYDCLSDPVCPVVGLTLYVSKP